MDGWTSRKELGFPSWFIITKKLETLIKFQKSCKISQNFLIQGYKQLAHQKKKIPNILKTILNKGFKGLVGPMMKIWFFLMKIWYFLNASH